VSQKKDGNRVLDVLEKMRVIKRSEDEADLDGVLEDEVTEELTEELEETLPAPAVQTVPAPPVYNPVPETPYGISGEDKSLFWEEEPQTPGVSTDQYLDIGQLYSVFNMKTPGVDTIYMIESYITTLPETLPAELRRSIILKIIDASGFDFDQLLNDGIDRVSQLNDYSARFASRTEEIVERHNVEIDALERQIQQIREAINERKNLHKRQFLTIESEAQRLKDVLDFITK
jgi:hypothetical protein